MQHNHVYVEDNGKGQVTVYDDEGKINPERKFTYSSTNREEARKKAEAYAASRSASIGCGWGCNYQGRRV